MTWRVHSVPAVGLAAAPLLGFLFGARLDAVHRPDPGRDHQPVAQRGAPPAAAPCSPASTAWGSGVPFIVAALAYRRALGAFAFVRRHQQWVTRVGGLMLVLVGLALVTGWWDQAVSWLQVHLVNNSHGGRVSDLG